MNRESGRLAATAAGGIMMGVAFPPIGFWPLAWGAMIPLFLAVAVLPREKAFLHGLAFFAPALGIPYHWMTLHRMMTPALVSTAALMAVMVSAAAMIALFSGRGHADRRAARIIAAASLLLVFEQLLMYGPVPFPAAVLGYAMADAVWLDPVLRTIGVSGVSLLLVGTSACAAALTATVAANPTRRSRHVQALLVLVAFLAGWISGPIPEPGAAERTPGIHTARLTLVQPALDPGTWADVRGPGRINALERRLDGLLRLGDEENPGLVVLPETALPAPALYSAGSTPEEWMHTWSARLDAALLAGAIIPPATSGHPDGAYVNAALLAVPEGDPLLTSNGSQAGPSVQRYEKEILVPFAERVPLVDRLPFLGALSVPAGGVSGYVRGRETDPLHVNGIRLGVLICFESLFPRLARRRLHAGSDLLVVLTQDGWWASNAVRRQHLLYSRMRAVETGVPLVQVSVDGESGTFDHRGRLRVHMPSGIPALQVVDIALTKRATQFARTGDRPVHIFLALALALAMLLMSAPRTPMSDS